MDLLRGRYGQAFCGGCFRATDWSRDDKTLLTFGGSPESIDRFDIAANHQEPLLRHPTYNLLYARFSPDNHWVSFTARTQPNRSVIFIAPLGGPTPIPKTEWIEVSQEGPADWANWSPDGNTLYFTSSRDGHTCLWAQRLDPQSHQPVGPAFALKHFHGHLEYSQGGWSAAGGYIAVALQEGTSNIWLMSRSHLH